MKSKSEAEILITIVVTAHAESILVHRTLASIRRAVQQLSNPQATEIILHIDNPTTPTQDYLNCHRGTTLKDVHVFTNHFGDLGASRNFAIQQAHGKYVATIDADDIMSERWLVDAIDLLELRDEPTIAHSEYTIEFEGTDSLIIKHGEIDYDTDTLLSVYANRWNSVIVAPRKLLLENLYTPNSPGYGYEDWNLNCRFIYGGVHNVLIPHTAIFVRRKRNNSEWARQVQSMSVLRANPLLAFDNIHSVTDPFGKAPSYQAISTAQRYYSVNRIKSLIKQYPTTHRIAKYIKRSIKRKEIMPKVSGSHVPEWLKKEWRELHAIDREIFPSKRLMETIAVYDTITEDHKLAGSLYKALVDQLSFNEYSYIIFAPWLSKGGADKYTIEYANTISKITHTHVLVVGTLPVGSPWKDKLSKDVSFLDFGNITIYASQEIKQRLMEHIVENSNARALHVINSEFGYDFVRLHENYIKSSGKKVIVTSFSQSIDLETGRIYGYSHTHVPFVYDIADIITSDNQAIIDMWVKDYGFDSKKLFVHHQPLDLHDVKNVKKDSTPHSPLRILWAGRIAPEKLPDIAMLVARKLQDTIHIDMYGSKEAKFDKLLNNLPRNVTYKGSYDGFWSLDINEYDVLLYTSLFDGMPNVLLEAAAAKLPIIASAVGGIPEFIKDHKNGTLVTNITDINSYIDAIHDFISNKRGEQYTEQSQIVIKEYYSRAQYIKSVSDMLKKMNLT